MAKTKKNHKWREGLLPQSCRNCGIIRSRQTFKTLMAVVNHPHWEVYKYESKIVYTTVNKTTAKRPECKGK